MPTALLAMAFDDDLPTPRELITEAHRYLNDQMSEEEKAEYLALLSHDSERRSALAEAMAANALADLADGTSGDEPDSELCDQVRELLPHFLIAAVSPQQRHDVDSHLEGCVECRKHLAALQREGRRRASPARRIGMSAILLGLGLLGGWFLRGDVDVIPSHPAPAEPPVLTDELRLELVDMAGLGKDRQRLLATAALVVQTVTIQKLLKPALPRQSVEDIKTCVQVIGRAGPNTPGAKQWVRFALIHPSPDVRREAAIWYKRVDRDWRADAEAVSLIEAARRATKIPVPASPDRPDQ